MPVDQTRLFDMVFDPNAKRLPGAGGDPEGSVGLGLPFTSMSRRSSRSTVGAASSVCPRARDATPTAIVPVTKPRRESMKISDAG